MTSTGTDTLTCHLPLVAESLFPDTGGYVGGRWCRDINLGEGLYSCCLPCPVTDWRYTDGFEGKMRIAGWSAIVVVVSMVFMLATYTFLPPSATARHYLTTVPIVGFIFLSTAFIVPLANPPDQCHDLITPNDHKSDPMCAATSILLISGIWIVVISCLFRSLSLHLIVVWTRTLGKRYMYISLACIILGTVFFLVLDLEVTGVSYQLGTVCYINPYDGWGTFWAPLLVVTGLTFLLQLITMSYCVFIVLRPIWHDREIFFPRRKPRSSAEYILGAEARQASMKTRKIIRMQWRPLLIVFMIVFNVIFLSIVILQAEQMYTYPTERFFAWIGCLSFIGGKNNCMNEAEKLGPAENLIVAVLFLLAVCGIWGIILVFRSSMILAWMEVFRAKSRESNVPHRDAEIGAPDLFSTPQSNSQNELSPLPKHQYIVSITSNDTKTYPNKTYVIPNYNFSTLTRGKAASPTSMRSL